MKQLLAALFILWSGAVCAQQTPSQLQSAITAATQSNAPPINKATLQSLLLGLNATYGNGSSSLPALVAGANVTITGSWPNYTISATGGGGGGGSPWGFVSGSTPITGSCLNGQFLYNNAGTGGCITLAGGGNLNVTGSPVVGQIITSTGGTNAIAQKPLELDPRKYLANVCNNGGAALSTVYGSIGLAQAAFPLIPVVDLNSLSQTLDWAVLQQSIYEVIGTPTATHGGSPGSNGQTILIPAGVCQLGNNYLFFRDAQGIIVRGMGRGTTQVLSNDTVLKTNGFWYSKIADITFGCGTAISATTACIAIDGAYADAYGAAPRGTQAIQYSNLLIAAGGKKYGLALNPVGGAGAQGDTQSLMDVSISNCRGANSACFYINGYNTLDINYYTGDIQAFDRAAIEFVNGSGSIGKLSIESTTGYTQIANSGCDIMATAGGAYDTITIYGARTESLVFACDAAGTQFDIRGFNQQPAAFSVTHQTSHAYVLNDMIKQADLNGVPRAYRITTAGTSSNVTPTFPASGTVTDGTAVWTMLQYNVINTPYGTFDGDNSQPDVTATVLAHYTRYGQYLSCPPNCVATPGVDYIIVDTTGGPKTVSLTDPALQYGGGQNFGHSVTVKRWSTDANDVTVNTVPSYGIDGTTNVATLPGKTKSWIKITTLGPGFGAPSWYLTGYGNPTCHPEQAQGTSCSFSQLPACNANTFGWTLGIVDSNVNTWGSVAAGGGANPVTVACNGTNWTVAGK
jgi:hypothetical protein